MIFRVQEEEYAFPTKHTREIIGYRPTTKLPTTPDYMEGTINLKGQVIPIIRLSAKFGLAGDRPEDRSIIILKVGALEIGIVVDEVTGVRHLAVASVEPIPGACDEPGACIKGIGKIQNRLIVLLDSSRLFTDDELTVFQLIQAEGEHGRKELAIYDPLERSNREISRETGLYKRKLQQLIIGGK